MNKFYYDEDAALKAISFIEKFCTHTKGDLTGKFLLLEPFQKKIVGDLFGWKNKKTKLRKYKVALIQLPRKNGKTTLAAAIILYVLYAGERGNELYAAAGSRGQANIIFSICADMIKQNEHLSQRAKVYRSSIVNESKGNFFKSISAESSTAHGFNSGFVLMDELHVQKNQELYQTLLTSQGARSEPLFISITTSGYDKNSIGYEVYSYAKKVQDKVILDDAFYPCIFEADQDDDITLESTWEKANPCYGVSLRKDYMEREAKRAVDVPSYQNTFKRLHLNIWTDSKAAWLTSEEWSACYDENFDWSSLNNAECYGGLDLSSTRDLTCLTLLFNIDGKFAFIPYIFIPEENAIKRSERDGVDYVLWKQQNHIITTPGDVTDYSFIRKKVNDLSKQFRIQSICYDRWGASQLIIDLQNDGCIMEGFGQGFVSMSNPTKTLEAEILAKNIIHNNNPCMNWCMSNISLSEDPAGNIKPNKKTSTERIDPIVSLVMSIGNYLSSDSSESIYDSRGIISF